jgi:GNAT superfamily N-acetyltransferase
MSVTELGRCPWFNIDDALPAFAFAWYPYAVSVTCSIQPELVTVETVYLDEADSETAIHMIRRLADIDDTRIAFHDALFVSAALNAQRRGFATEMLRQCVSYYRSIGVDRVIIPSAVEAGRTVWPKFGFRPTAQIAARFADFAAEVHLRKTGERLSLVLPACGPDILQFCGEYGLPVGQLALGAFSPLTLELDLTDPSTVDFLGKRGITVP